MIRFSSIRNQITEGPILFNHVGKSATVTVFYDQGGFKFQTNGLPEASVLGRGTGDSWKHSGVWLAGLPPVLRDGMESMLIIGLGGGVAASAVPPSIRQIDVVELEPSVIEANRVVASRRNRDPLSDPRLRLILNDARNALALTDRRYDAIVSQPSHPWTAGASHLYTREFAEIAQHHLTPGGVFVQWMGANFLDSDLLRSMTATLRDAFEHVRIYQPVQGTLMFVASGEPIVPEMRPSLGVADADRNYYLRMGLVRPEHLLAILTAEGAGVDALAEGAPLILDERNLLAMRAPRLLRRTSEDEVEATLRQVHPLSQGQSHVRELCPTVDFFSFTRRLIDHGYLELARQHGVPSIVPSSRRDFVQAELEREQSGRQSWLAYLATQADTSDPVVAFSVLHADLVGRIALSPETRERLHDQLTQRHRKLLEVIRPTIHDDLEASRTEDAFLASIPVDDIAFEIAVTLRLPWRLAETGPDSQQRHLEVIQIIDDYNGFISFVDVAYFRALAAIHTGQSTTALATAVTAARIVEEAQAESDRPIGQSTFKHLMRIRLLLSHSVLFPNAPRDRYLEVRAFVESVASQLKDARLAAGQPIPDGDSL